LLLRYTTEMQIMTVMIITTLANNTNDVISKASILASSRTPQLIHSVSSAHRQQMSINVIARSLMTPRQKDRVTTFN